MQIYIIAKSVDAIDIQSVYISVTAVSVEEINIHAICVHKRSISNQWTYTGEEAPPHGEEPEYEASVNS